MSPAAELRALRAIVLAMVTVPIVAAPVMAFGGLDGLAALFARPAPRDVDPSLRDHLRAIGACFAGFGLLGAWSLYALEERKTAFRIVAVTIIFAGLGRVTGWIVDGYPGIPAIVLMTLELVVFPILLAWHARLLRLART